MVYMGQVSKDKTPTGYSEGESSPVPVATTIFPRQIEALLEISTLLNGNLNTGRFLQDVLDKICKHFQADRAAVFLREKLLPASENQTISEAHKHDTGPIICPAHLGLSSHYIETMTAFYEQSEFRQLQATLRPVYISDIEQGLNVHLKFNRSEGFHSMATLPLIYQATLLGTLVLYHDQVYTYFEPETSVLNLVSNQLALAIANARLYEQARSREHEAAQLADAGRIFNSSLTTHEVLNRVVRTVGEMIGNSALVYIIQERLGEAYPVAFYSKALYHQKNKTVSPVKNSQAVLPGKGAIGRVLQTNVPLLMLDPAEITRAIPFIAPEHEVNGLVCVPLRARGQIIGALLSYQLTAGQPAKPYGDEQLGLALALADRAAVAIDNARRYDAEKRQQHVKDEFLALVSHELYTPLANIKGFNQLLARKLIDAVERAGTPNPTVDSLRHYTEIMGGQIDRLQLLVNDLTKISLIETGQLKATNQAVRLVPLVQAEVKALEKALLVNRDRQNRHRLSVAAVDPNLTVQGDSHFVTRILQNLLSNAIKFSPEGGLVRVDLVASPGRTVKLTVSDQGIGLSTHDLPHIFDRFYKTSSHPGRANGLGLGLYLSKSLAEAMGGHLLVSSQEGHGSSFTLQLIEA